MYDSSAVRPQDGDQTISVLALCVGGADDGEDGEISLKYSFTPSELANN